MPTRFESICPQDKLAPCQAPIHRSLLHIVFSTKGRQPWITPEVRDRLHTFIGGVVGDEKGSLLAIGGMPDHEHLLVRWRTDEDIATLMRHVKARSSRWVHETFPTLRAFAWQEGYSVFSVSKSGEGDVRSYIENQGEHHKKWDFKAELLKLLRAHEVEFEEKYVFD